MLFSKKSRLNNILKVGGTAGTMGLHLVSATFVGLLMGYYLDKWMLEYFDVETNPWLTMIFLIFGIVSGFRMVIQDVKRMQKDQENQKNAGSEHQDD